MRKRSVRNHRLSVLCLLAVALPVLVTAQDYPPNGPKIPPVALTGGYIGITLWLNPSSASTRPR